MNGAGQNGLWEDMAGRTGDIAKVRALRSNIARYAKNSAEAKQAWTDDPSFDAWIIWGIWQKANPTLADAVPVEESYRIYRDVGAGLTTTGKSNPDAVAFTTAHHTGGSNDLCEMGVGGKLTSLIMACF